VVWRNQGDNGIPGKGSKGLTAAGAGQPTCEELSVAGGILFLTACCPARRVREVDVGAALSLIFRY